MDPILAMLRSSLPQFVEYQLSNNDIAFDVELLEDFVSSGLTEEQALRYRSQYLCNIYLEGFTLILKNAQARHFNPYSRQFESD